MAVETEGWAKPCAYDCGTPLHPAFRKYSTGGTDRQGSVGSSRLSLVRPRFRGALLLLAVGALIGCTMASAQANARVTPSITSALTTPSSRDEATPITAPGSTDLFLTETDTGLIRFTDVPNVDLLPLGVLVDRASFVEALTERGNVAIWPPTAYDDGIEGLEPIARADEAAQGVADWFYGTSDLIDCWTGDPPEVLRTGHVFFGGPETNVAQSLAEYASPEDAAASLAAVVDGTGLTSNPQSLRFVYTSGDQEGQGLKSSSPCGGFDIGEMTPCGSIGDCFQVSPASSDEPRRLIAQRGPWIVTLGTTGIEDSEVLMTQALMKLPS